MALVPRFVEIGWDFLDPLEVKAGMDAPALKRDFGDRLTLVGGIDVRTMLDPAAMEREVATKIPALKVGGGYCYLITRC